MLDNEGQYYQPYFTQYFDPREKWFEEDHAVNQSQTQTPGLKSAVAQLPFIDSTMSQKAPVHMVPKITGNQQNSQTFYSVTSLERVLLGQISFFPSIIQVLLH